jgi:hypothetical protein
MSLLSFFQKKESSPMAIEPEAEKKIEFSQKLGAEDLEGKPVRKGGAFAVPSSPPERKAGEATAVKIEPERSAAYEEKETDLDASENDKAPAGTWTDKFLKFIGSGGTAGRKKGLSRVLEVNLVRGEIVKYFDWQKSILVLLVSIFATLAFLSLVYWGISWWGTTRQYAGDTPYLQDYYKISKEIKDLDPQVNEIMKFKDQLDLVNFLLVRHVYWTNFFDFLENNTLSNVYFSNFTGDIKGSYSLRATTNNLDAIDAQIKKMLVNSNIKKAEVNAGSVGGEGGKPVVTFSLSFVLDPKIFLK